MKTHRQSWHVRKIALSLALISGLALIVFSCKKDEDDGVITSDEMAEAVVQSFSSQGGGLVVQTNAALSVVSAANTDNTGKLADQTKALTKKPKPVLTQIQLLIISGAMVLPGAAC